MKHDDDVDILSRSLVDLFAAVWDRQHERLSKDGVVSLRDVLDPVSFDRVFDEIVEHTTVALAPDVDLYHIQPSRFSLEAMRSFVRNSEEVKIRRAEEGVAEFVLYDLDQDLNISEQVAEETIRETLRLEDCVVTAINCEAWDEADAYLRTLYATYSQITDDDARRCALREAHAFSLEVAGATGDAERFLNALRVCAELGGPLSPEFVAPHLSCLMEQGFGFDGIRLSVSLVGKLLLRMHFRGGSEGGKRGERKVQKDYIDMRKSEFLDRLNKAFSWTVLGLSDLDVEDILPLFEMTFSVVRKGFYADHPGIEAVGMRFIS